MNTAVIGYDVILVDGRLAIRWHDETNESAVARKRAEESVVTAEVAPDAVCAAEAAR